jgi:predicted nucleotidyltransferase
MGDRQLWEDLAERYRRAFGDRLHGLAAFGSRARGTAGPESDHDILLVAEGLSRNPLERSAEVGEPLSGLGLVPVQVTARTPAEFLADITPLHLDLAVDAVVLFERDGFLSRHLGRVRERIAEAGLERGPDLFWRWRQPPGPGWAICWDGVRR